MLERLIRAGSKKNCRKFSHPTEIGGGILDSEVHLLELLSYNKELQIPERGLQAFAAFRSV